LVVGVAGPEVELWVLAVAVVVVVGGQVGLLKECDEAIKILDSVDLDLRHLLSHSSQHKYHSLLPVCEVPRHGWNRLKLISK
jgi:hypothetical protein